MICHRQTCTSTTTYRVTNNSFIWYSQLLPAEVICSCCEVDAHCAPLKLTCPRIRARLIRRTKGLANLPVILRVVLPILVIPIRSRTKITVVPLIRMSVFGTWIKRYRRTKGTVVFWYRTGSVYGLNGSENQRYERVLVSGREEHGLIPIPKPVP